MTDPHWHVASGLTGYGPEAADTTFGTAHTIRELATLIEDDLKNAAKSEFETASAIVHSPDNDPDSVPLENYKEAWLTDKHGEELATIAMNFSTDRLNAPAYVDNEPLWEESIKRLLVEHFGSPLVIAYNSSLYVWQCGEKKCEHVEDDEASVHCDECENPITKFGVSKEHAESCSLHLNNVVDVRQKRD